MVVHVLISGMPCYSIKLISITMLNAATLWMRVISVISLMPSETSMSPNLDTTLTAQGVDTITRVIYTSRLSTSPTILIPSRIASSLHNE